MRAAAIFLASLLASPCGWTQEAPPEDCAILESTPATAETAKSGCCSWHDGVCGCSGGRAQCCDGTQSPSCGCRAESDERAP